MASTTATSEAEAEEEEEDSLGEAASETKSYSTNKKCSNYDDKNMLENNNVSAAANTCTNSTVAFSSVLRPSRSLPHLKKDDAGSGVKMTTRKQQQQRQRQQPQFSPGGYFYEAVGGVFYSLDGPRISTSASNSNSEAEKMSEQQVIQSGNNNDSGTYSITNQAESNAKAGEYLLFSEFLSVQFSFR